MKLFLISQRFRQILLLTWIILGLCCFHSSVKAETDKKKPLVIAISQAYSPFTVISPTGKPTGIFVEMWRLWSKQTGMPIEFLVNDWSGSLQALRDGRADVHSGLFINDKRAEWMDFSDPIHEIQTSLFFRGTDEANRSLNDMNGKKVGAIKGFYQLQYLIDNYKNIKAVSFPDGQSLILGLLKGEVDAILNENVMVETDLASFAIRGDVTRGIQAVFSNHVVAAVRKDRRELLPVIKAGFDKLPIKQMTNVEKRWLPSPDDRFYERLLMAKKFTPEEEGWIRENPAVTVGATNSIPRLDVVEQGGAYKGLNPDLLSLLSKRTGLEFVPVFKPKWNKVLQSVMSAEVDIGLNMSRTPEREKEILFTSPYAFVPLLAVVKNDYNGVSNWAELNGKRVAILKGAAIREELKKNIGDKGELITTKSVTESMKLVKRGEADVLIAGLIRYNKVQSEQRVKGLKIAARYVGEGGIFRIGIHNSKPMLVKILDKGLKRIKHQELVDIRERWLTIKKNQELDLTDKERTWIQAHPKITTNGDEWRPFVIRDNRGIYSGISVDILKIAIEKLGLEVEFVQGTWSEMIRMLKDQKLDLLSDIVTTPERRKAFHLTNPYIETPDAVYVLDHNDSIQSIKDLDGKTVPVVKDYYVEELLKTKYPKVKQIQVSSPIEAIKMVVKGEADAYIGALTVSQYEIQKNMITGLKIAFYCYEIPFNLCMGVGNKSQILGTVIQKALDSITAVEKRKIIEQYISFSGLPAEQKKISLSKTEKAWIEQRKRPVTVGAEMDWPPFDFVIDGNPTGYSNELLRQAADKAGLPIKFVFGLTWAALIDKMKMGDIDILPAVYKTPAREKEMIMTKHYSTNPSVLVGHEKNLDITSFKDLSGKKLVVVEGFSINKLMQENHPQIQQIQIKNVIEALKAVSLGKADAFVGSLGVISHILKENLIPNIRIVDEVSLNDPEATHLHMAVLKDQTVLHNILQKGLDAISEAELNELRIMWLGLGLIKDKKPKFKLTVQEREWLAQNHIVRVNVGNWPPFRFGGDSPKGISVDYIKKIFAFHNIGYKLISGEDISWKKSLQYIKDHQEIDLLPTAKITEERKEYMVFTDDYLFLPWVIFSRNDSAFISNIEDLNRKTVAVPEGYVMHDLLAKNYPDIKLKLISGGNPVQQCMEFLAIGEVDAYVGNLTVGSYIIDQNGYSNLKVAAPTPFGTHNQAMGIRDVLKGFFPGDVFS